ncbi:hypothetical protein pb186bvf_009804 [Paramecium bursaria]
MDIFGLRESHSQTNFVGRQLKRVFLKAFHMRQTVTYNSRFIKSLIVLIATRLKCYASQGISHGEVLMNLIIKNIMNNQYLFLLQWWEGYQKPNVNSNSQLSMFKKQYSLQIIQQTYLFLESQQQLCIWKEWRFCRSKPTISNKKLRQNLNLRLIRRDQVIDNVNKMKLIIIEAQIDKYPNINFSKIFKNYISYYFNNYSTQQIQLNHICNKDSHQCKFLCQKPGICQISSYSELMKTWTTKTGCQFQYTVIKQNPDKLQM